MFCKKSNKQEVQLQVRLKFVVKQLTEFNQRKYLVTKKFFLFNMILIQIIY